MPQKFLGLDLTTEFCDKVFIICVVTVGPGRLKIFAGCIYTMWLTHGIDTTGKDL